MPHASSTAQLAELGIARISFGGLLWDQTMRAFADSLSVLAKES
jgi:hypothetical protein